MISLSRCLRLKQSRRRLGQLLLPTLLLCVLAVPVRADHAGPNILILHSYDPEMNWTAGINAAMSRTLLKARPQPSLHVEYLDSKRNPDPAYRQSFIEGVLPAKLAGRKFQLVLSSDNAAFNFVRRHHQDLFADTPMVFCGVNGYTPEMRAGFDNLTGVAEAPAFQETIEVARQLHPGTDEIIIIGETQTETGRKIDETLRSLPGKLTAGTSITFWNDIPLEKLEPRLDKLKPGHLILLVSVLREESGRVYSYSESARHVREHSPAPIYGVWDFLLGEGIVGGRLTSAEAQGRLAAEIGLRILAGEATGTIPVVAAEANQYMFDARELQRFNISLKQLPAGSVVINRPPGFYRLDKWQFWTGLLFMVLLSLCTFLLLRIMLTRRRAEAALAERARIATLGAEIGKALTQATDLQATLQRCLETMVRQTGTAFGRIWTVSGSDPQLLELQASAGLHTHIDGSHRFKRVGELKVGIIASERQPILTNRVAGDPLFTDQEWVVREKIIGFAGYPLVVQDRLVGVVAFFSQVPLSDTVQTTIGSVADMIAVGIERLRSQQALQTALHDTAESRDKIDAILASVADGLIVTDLQNRVVLINQAAEQMLGIPFARACCEPLEIVLQGKPFQAQLLSLFNGPQPETEFSLKKNTAEPGHFRTIQGRTAPVHRRDGSIGGTVAILRDVTRERELDQMKNEFIAMAAHELRTPLATVIGYAELLLNEAEGALFTPQQRHEFLGYILAKGEELEKIIDDLLDMGRLETGRVIQLEKVQCEMVSLVKEIVRHHQQETDRHTFITECPAQCLNLSIDRNKMQRVFDNLLSNAVKYSPQGGDIRISGQAQGDRLVITIEDQGIGMTAEQAAQAFNKFYRGDASDTAVRGLGLGMTISKGIIEAHGGEIWLDSTPGQGTRVSFSLPLDGLNGPSA